MPYELCRPAARPLRGVVQVPGDKSISHRALLLGALCREGLRVQNLCPGLDVRSTAACLRALGVHVRVEAAAAETAGDRAWVSQPGRVIGPREPLDCGNAGTAMRLLAGWLAGQPVAATLIGDASLSRRPMRRVAAPLRAMGADVRLSAADTAPVRIEGRPPLRAIAYELPVASAQVKSAVMLAALHADGPSTVRDPFGTRDHTERMLHWLDGDSGTPAITRDTGRGPAVAAAPAPAPAPAAITWRIEPRPHGLRGGGTLTVPGDPSAAAFWMVAAAIIPGSELMLPAVCLNPTRTGALRTLQAMGADITVQRPREEAGEPVGDLCVRHTTTGLRGVTLTAQQVPALIDEIPVLAVAAAAAEGESRFAGLAELRVKESDRLAGTVALVRGLGAEAHVEGEHADTLVVRGRPLAAPVAFAGGNAQPLVTRNDHRLAMAAAVAALAAAQPVRIDSLASAAISDPGFVATIVKWQK